MIREHKLPIKYKVIIYNLMPKLSLGGTISGIPMQTQSLGGSGKKKKSHKSSSKTHRNSSSKSGPDHVVIGLIYAEWCPHCKTLVKPENQSIWDTIEKSLRENPRFDVRKYEETKDTNEIEALKTNYGVSVNGYPTIYKIEKGGPKYTRDGNGHRVEYYQGNREVQPMLTWMNGGERMYGGSKRHKSKRRSKLNHFYKRK